MKTGFEFRNTGIALVLSILVYLTSLASHVEVFEFLIEFLEDMEVYELDEILMGGLLCLVGIVTDFVRIRNERKKIIEIQTQRLQTLKATMVTVQDIVNNALNGLQILRIKSKSRSLSSEELKMFDAIVFETVEKIKELRSLEDTPVKDVAGGLHGIDMEVAMKNKKTDREKSIRFDSNSETKDDP